MSIVYAIYQEDIYANGKALASVSLSNTGHADWQKAADVGRWMKNTETGETEHWLFHTTIHDKERLFFFTDELDFFIYAAIDEGFNDTDTLELLQMILNDARKYGCKKIFV